MFILALTTKQHKFCENIVAGYGTKEAYINAYNNNSNDNTAYKEATKLLAREDIQAAIKDMRKPLIIHAQTQAFSNREKQIKEIETRIAICKEKEDENSLIRYYDMLNKLYNLYKETETDKQAENNIDNLDISALQKLSGIA